MKVKLHELVALVADVDEAARLIVDLDAVAVVDDPERRAPIVEVDRWQNRFGCDVIVDVDRGLRLALCTGAVVLFESSPVLRSGGSAVAPVRVLVGERRGTRYQGNHDESR